jgi:uncharacterized protein (TIGR02246 family)
MITELRTDEAAVRALLDAIVTAFNNQDIEALLALHTDDIVLMDPGMPTVQGKEQMQYVFARFKAERISIQLEITIHELKVCGDMAFFRGLVFGSKTKAAESPIQITGRVLCLFRKEAPGRWLRSHVMVNNL